MCTTNVYSYVHPDGRKEPTYKRNLCPASRHGHPCANNVVFQHPSQYLSSSYSNSSSSSPYMGGPLAGTDPFLPTPTYTPRSSTPNYQYRSGDESDLSYGSYGSYSSYASASGAASSSKKKRRHHSSIYIDGQRVVDLNTRRSERENKPRRERIVLVDNPPTPRTPPTSYTFPHTAPSSPSLHGPSQPFVIDASPRRTSSSRRPVIVDERTHRVERPRVHIEVVDSSRRSKHSRQTSTSSHDSRRSGSSSSAAAAAAASAGPQIFSTSSDEERDRRLRREKREERRKEDRLREKQEIRDQKLRDRIAEANARIASRPAVPVPSAPSLKRSSTYTRPAVEVPTAEKSYEADLAEAVRHMDLKEKRRTRRGEKQVEWEDEEAQRQRLMERMMPRRRATVGPGSRRHRVLYDDGMYRWE